MRPAQVKVVLVGDANVGKTSLLRYLVDQSPLDNPPNTTSIYLTVHRMDVRGRQVSVNLWDTAGEEQYRSLASVYLRSAKGVLVVFDLTCRASLESVNYWLEYVETALDVTPAILVVGNKRDDPGRAINDAEIRDFCTARGVTWVETSAITGENVASCFATLVEAAMETGTRGSGQGVTLSNRVSERVCC